MAKFSSDEQLGMNGFSFMSRQIISDSGRIFGLFTHSAIFV